MNETDDFQSSHVSTITADKKSYRIALPDHATDYIQKTIKDSGRPYEPEMLDNMAQRLSQDDLVLDVGANIGNHSLYLAAVAGCRVIAFEPNAHLAAAIVHSAALNDLAAQIDVVAKGVGATPGPADFAEDIKGNLGAQALVPGAGEIEIITLDSMTFPTKVAALKIDVEGMEIEVLRGAAALIARDRPILYIECMDQAAFETILGLLDPTDYLIADTFNATPTHLFLPKEKAPSAQETQAPMRRLLSESYRNRAALDKTQTALNAANLKYRDVTAQIRSMREATGKQEEICAKLKHDLTAAHAQIKELRALRDGPVSPETSDIAEPETPETPVDSPAEAAAPRARRKSRRRMAIGRTASDRQASWILSQVSGAHVLDIGPGEKELPFLLAREGFDVVATDTDPDVIARARARLTGEPEIVRARIRFALTPLFHRGNEAPVDTVILHGVLEHAANPAQILDLAMARLTPEGRLIVAVTFGLSHAQDPQAQVFFPGTLYAALAPHGHLTRLEIMDGVMLAVLDRVAQTDAPEHLPELAPETLLSIAEKAMQANQLALLRRIAITTPDMSGMPEDPS